MNIVLWIAQGFLAAAFLMAGLMKALKPKEELQKKMAWAEDFKPGTIKEIGILEILGALGLILPAALKVVPILTPVAASGLVVVMIGAAVVHLRRGELPFVAVNAVLIALLGFVVYGRFLAVPIVA